MENRKRMYHAWSNKIRQTPLNIGNRIAEPYRAHSNTEELRRTPFDAKENQA